MTKVHMEKIYHNILKRKVDSLKEYYKGPTGNVTLIENDQVASSMY